MNLLYIDTFMHFIIRVVSVAFEGGFNELYCLCKGCCLALRHTSSSVTG